MVTCVQIQQMSRMDHLFQLKRCFCALQILYEHKQQMVRCANSLLSCTYRKHAVRTFYCHAYIENTLCELSIDINKQCICMHT